MSFKGQTAWITGASSGIGAALAKALAKATSRAQGIWADARAGEDVAAFLMWTAEPQLMARKRMGFTAVILLIILSTLLYLTNKRLWAPVKRAAKEG